MALRPARSYRQSSAALPPFRGLAATESELQPDLPAVGVLEDGDAASCAPAARAPATPAGLGGQHDRRRGSGGSSSADGPLARPPRAGWAAGEAVIAVGELSHRRLRQPPRPRTTGSASTSATPSTSANCEDSAVAVVAGCGCPVE